MSKGIISEREDGKYFIYNCHCSHKIHLVRFQKAGEDPRPTWSFNGDIDTPTISPSVNNFFPEEAYTNNPGLPKYVCHHFVKNGRIEYCGDSTDKKDEVPLAGKTIDMIEWDEEKTQYYK